MTAAGPPPDTSANHFRFGDFELRPAGRELLRDGVPVELQPKVFDFIAYLLQHRDRAVGKEELLAAVWPGQVVTDSALSRCVRRAREALDDSADHPWAIQTLHARGFRFLAAVAEIAAPAAHAPSAADVASSPAPAARPWPRRILFASVLALLALGALAWWWDGVADRPAANDALVRIAVLPVENATGEARHDWTRLGLMSSISEILRRQATVRTLNPRDVLAVAEQSPSTSAEVFDTLRRRYGVTHVVEGRLERAPGQLRLFYGLIDRNGVRRERTVTGADIADLAHAAGADLRVLLGYARGKAVARDTFVNEAYLRGIAVRLQGDVEGALKYFRVAAEQAPQAFWPRYEIALGLRDLGRLPEAIEALEALRDEAARGDDAEARRDVGSALGVAYWRAGELGRAAERLDEALRIAEEVGDGERTLGVLNNLGILLTYRGDYAAARRHLTRALEIEAGAGIERSTGAIANSLGQLDLREGFHDAADQHLRTALEQFRLIGEQRNEAIVTNGLGELRCAQGRYGEARELFARALPVHRRLGNRVSEAAALIGLSCAEAGFGRLQSAIEHAEAALALAGRSGNRQNEGLAQGLLGQHYRQLGDFAEAGRWTQTAIDTHLAGEDIVRAREERLQLARLAMAGQRWDEASRLAAGVREEAEASGHRQPLAEARHLLARIALATGDRAAAADWLDRARTGAERMSNRRLLAELALTRAELALAANDLAAAADALAIAEARLEASSRLARLQADLAAARGDHGAAYDLELAAREAAGEGWRPADEARLQARARARGR